MTPAIKAVLDRGCAGAVLEDLEEMLFDRVHA
jgi:hypothetical protein